MSGRPRADALAAAPSAATLEDALAAATAAAADRHGLTLVWAPEGPSFDAALALRLAVFCGEQGVPLDLERDRYDDPPARGAGHAHHVMVGEALAGGRWRAHGTGRFIWLAAERGTGLVDGPGEVAKLQRIAVGRERRGTGLGRVVMDALEAAAAVHGARWARLGSQVEAVGFYERLGYQVWGEPFLDAGIDHRWMDKRLRTA